MIFLFFTNPENLILRVVGAAIASFFIVILMGPRLIRYLIRKKVGDRPEFDHADLNRITKDKSNTPTMGGILIVVAIFISVLLFADVGKNMYVQMGLMTLVWLGALGAADDWFKLRRVSGATSRDGLKMWEKIVFQIGLPVLLAIFIWSWGRESTPVGDTMNPTKTFYLPIGAGSISLGLLGYIVITVLTMVGASNAVNLTDGMDGLAAGCMIPVAVVMLIVSIISGVQVWADFLHLPLVAGAGEMAIFCAAMLGACVGFLWYNAHPAQVFMGDTGSLAMGGLIGYIAVVTRQELLLLIAGGVFAMEAGSVVLQVGYFKITKRRSPTGQGKRLFRVAPIHHHFHLGGWAKSKVVIRFWIIGILLAALALATLKMRGESRPPARPQPPATERRVETGESLPPGMAVAAASAGGATAPRAESSCVTPRTSAGTIAVADGGPAFAARASMDRGR